MARIPVVTFAIVSALCALPCRGTGPRPVVAIVAANGGTETTDFLVPYGVMAASEAVDLHAVSTRSGPVELHPALKVELRETIDSFDAAHPAGAQFVIVPAVMERNDPTLVAWLAGQAQRGATLVAICDGAWTVAATGALKGRRATGHWYSLDDLAKTFPDTTWVRNRRYVRDGSVMTTTGVTASIPASLALIEEIAGAARAHAVAEQLGVHHWDDAHESDRFVLSRRDMATAAGNWLAFWDWERVGITVAPGNDEIALGLTADALARTYRTSVFAVASSPDPIALKHGLRLVPDLSGDAPPVDRMQALAASDVPITAVLDQTLASIEQVNGSATADFVALQIEYPERRRLADAPR